MQARKMNKFFVGYIAVIFIVISATAAQKDKVSPKLDFDEHEQSQEHDNTSVTSTKHHGTTGSGGRGTSPKIHGVRVSVDNGDQKKSSKESKESSEITEGRNTKRVGIHTDITFEITGEGIESNSTVLSGRGHDNEENDASVPVYKGRGSSNHKPRKPYDPKSHHWNPNYSAERGRGHHHTPHNVPVFPGTNDEGVYRSIDSWSNFVPITSVWTTERSYYEPYRPTSVANNGFKTYETYGSGGGPRWKPCYCISSGPDRRRRDNPMLHATARSPVIHVVDSKLDGPFSAGKKRK